MCYFPPTHIPTARMFNLRQFTPKCHTSFWVLYEYGCLVVSTGYVCTSSRKWSRFNVKTIALLWETFSFYFNFFVLTWNFLVLLHNFCLFTRKIHIITRYLATLNVHELTLCRSWILTFVDCSPSSWNTGGEKITCWSHQLKRKLFCFKKSGGGTRSWSPVPKGAWSLVGGGLGSWPGKQQLCFVYSCLCESSMWGCWAYSHVGPCEYCSTVRVLCSTAVQCSTAVSILLQYV